MKINPKIWSEIKALSGAIPLLDDIQPWLNQLFKHTEDWPDVASLNHLAVTMNVGFQWEFVRQEPVPRRAKSRGAASLSGYNQLILGEKKIPVREGELHDVLNALTFIMFPRSKELISARHRLESPSGIKPGQNRTRTQDLLTIFDEGGVLRLRGQDAPHRDIVFGHAVYEHIIRGRSLRAARLDLDIADEINSKPIQQITAIADREFAAWLGDYSHCRSQDEFSSLGIC